MSPDPMNPALPLAPLFAGVLAAWLCLKLWLGARQIRHVAQNADAVPEQFAGSIGLDDHRRAAQYTIARQRLAIVEALLATAMFLVLTWGGLLQWLTERAGETFGDGVAAEIALIVTVLLIQGIADLPIEWARRFRIEQRFGFNRMTPLMFASDIVKTLAIAAVLGVPLLWIVLELMRRAGDAWWIGAWAVWTAFTLLLTILYPVAIAPMFNRFTPLADGPLRQSIARLLERTGFRSSGVFTMDGSRRSSHGNAYFTGLGAAKRVVFFDTLVERLHTEEIEAVLAHELGHFRLHHVAKGIAGSLLLALGWLALLGWLRNEAWFPASLGVHPRAGGAGDGVLLVLFLLVMPLVGFALAPVHSAISRRHEFAADAFAARHASAHALVRALVKLYQDNAATLTPDPLHSAFYDSHPPAAIRIDRLLAQAPVPEGAV